MNSIFITSRLADLLTLISSLGLIGTFHYWGIVQLSLLMLVDGCWTGWLLHLHGSLYTIKPLLIFHSFYRILILMSVTKCLVRFINLNNTYSYSWSLGAKADQHLSYSSRTQPIMRLNLQYYHLNRSAVCLSPSCWSVPYWDEQQHTAYYAHWKSLFGGFSDFDSKAHSNVTTAASSFDQHHSKNQNQPYTSLIQLYLIWTWVVANPYDEPSVHQNVKGNLQHYP